MAENICPRCGAKMTIDVLGNVSCDYCGYERISDVAILDARGKAEIAAKKEAAAMNARRSARAAEVASYNAKINLLCSDYAAEAKPVKGYTKKVRVFGWLNVLPIAFFVLYAILLDFDETAADAFLGIGCVALIADIFFTIVAISSAVARRRANVKLNAIRAEVYDLLAAHPDGNRSGEVYDWLNQFTKD